MLKVLCGLAVCVSADLSVWHITDVHVDPLYVTGSIAGSGCYCETHDVCNRVSEICAHTDDPALQSGPFGMPEQYCATPPSLWESAMSHMSYTDGSAPVVFFTGDFGQAGLSTACNSSLESGQEQVLTNIAHVWAGLRAAAPSALVYGVMGNHDTSPGDYYGSTEEMAWLYTPVANDYIGLTFADDAAAIQSLTAYGWYATDVPASTAPGDGLTVIGLNTNYWFSSNPALVNSSSPGVILGLQQLSWLNATLASIAARRRVAWILGHTPPHAAWLPGIYPTYRSMMTLYPTTVAAAFFGHDHVDHMTIVRTCTLQPNATVQSVMSAEGARRWAQTPAQLLRQAFISPDEDADVPPAPFFHSLGEHPAESTQAQQWVETTGVEWCSGVNFDTGDVFGAGLWENDAWCPFVPLSNGTATGRIEMCEAVCGSVSDCRGFTWYPTAGAYGSCCFRTDVSNMPLNASSPNECFAKPSLPGPCDGAPETPLYMLYAAPSLTEGYPPSNPALRQYSVDEGTFQVTGMRTWFGNLSQANANWAFLWQVEYDAAASYGMSDLSPASWEDAFRRMGVNESETWAAFYAVWTKSYRGPSYEPCDFGACKDTLLAWMNGTTVDS